MESSGSTDSGTDRTILRTSTSTPGGIKPVTIAVHDPNWLDAIVSTSPSVKVKRFRFTPEELAAIAAADREAQRHAKGRMHRRSSDIMANAATTTAQAGPVAGGGDDPDPTENGSVGAENCEAMFCLLDQRNRGGKGSV
jgi:hypothetical protein